MMNMETFLRPHIAQMEAYTPILPFEVLSAQLGLPADEIIKLDANENPYGMLPAVKTALAQLPYGHIYPDPESRLLRRAIAEYYRVPFENILPGAGADELIDLILRAVIDPDDAILNCPPTFGMYAFDTAVNNGRVITVPRRPDFGIDLEAVIQEVKASCPKVIFIANPNNPDGGYTPPEEIAALLDLPVLVVLDEAYIDFADQAVSWLDHIARQGLPANLIVLRTFSKWAGLAGMRVGFGIFPDWLIPHLWKIKQPYNVSVAAQTAAIVSLENAGQLRQTGQAIVAERQRMFAGLQTIPWLAPYPSQTNFILCRVLEKDALTVKTELARKGILIRYFNKPGLQDHIRISVGRPEETSAILAALQALTI